MTAAAKDVALTDEEAALYDRQIRQWGLDSQKRLRNASLLISGITGPAVEIIKNLVLAGIGSVTLADDSTVQEEDLAYQFFIDSNSVGEPRVEAMVGAVRDMNPRVDVRVTQKSPSMLDASVVAGFDLVCMCNGGSEDIARVNEHCRRAGVLFYAVRSYGLFGWVFNDLGDKYDFATEKIGADKQKSMVSESKSWTSFRDSVEKWEPAGGSKLSRKQVKRKYAPLLFGFIGLLRFDLMKKGSHETPDGFNLFREFQIELFSKFGIDADICSLETMQYLFQNQDCDIAPVSAILGGVVAQDLIRCISHRDLPIRNWFFFDGILSTGVIQDLVIGG